jgi:hypothetical protein
MLIDGGGATLKPIPTLPAEPPADDATDKVPL